MAPGGIAAGPICLRGLVRHGARRHPRDRQAAPSRPPMGAGDDRPYPYRPRGDHVTFWVGNNSLWGLAPRVVCDRHVGSGSSTIPGWPTIDHVPTSRGKEARVARSTRLAPPLGGSTVYRPPVSGPPREVVVARAPRCRR